LDTKIKTEGEESQRVEQKRKTLQQSLNTITEQLKGCEKRKTRIRN